MGGCAGSDVQSQAESSMQVEDIAMVTVTSILITHDTLPGPHLRNTLG
jgi:hypothetical protein